MLLVALRYGSGEEIRTELRSYRRVPIHIIAFSCVCHLYHMNNVSETLAIVAFTYSSKANFIVCHFRYTCTSTSEYRNISLRLKRR